MVGGLAPRRVGKGGEESCERWVWMEVDVVEGKVVHNAPIGTHMPEDITPGIRPHGASAWRLEEGSARKDGVCQVMQSQSLIISLSVVRPNSEDDTRPTGNGINRPKDETPWRVGQDDIAEGSQPRDDPVDKGDLIRH
nr:hypothetical protein Iba_chr03cCG2490 [Ipomoea batatas]